MRRWRFVRWRFWRKRKPDKLTSVVEKDRVSVGNESSTAPLVLNALFLYKYWQFRCNTVVETKWSFSTMSDAPMCRFQFQYSCLQSKMTLVTMHPILISCAQWLLGWSVIIRVCSSLIKQRDRAIVMLKNTIEDISSWRSVKGKNNIYHIDVKRF